MLSAHHNQNCNNNNNNNSKEATSPKANIINEVNDETAKLNPPILTSDSIKEEPSHQKISTDSREHFLSMLDSIKHYKIIPQSHQLSAAILKFSLHDGEDKIEINKLLSGIKHKCQLEQVKRAISFVLKDLIIPEYLAKNDFYNEKEFRVILAFRLLKCLEGLKDSLILAIGNQICYHLVHDCFPLKNELKIISNLNSHFPLLKKLVVLNYLLLNRRIIGENNNQSIESLDLWVICHLLHELPVAEEEVKEINELDSVLDIERDLFCFRNGAKNSFCRFNSLLTVTTKQNYLRLENKVSMRHELQVTPFKII